MTIKEAQYFKKYIDGRLNDILGAMTQQQLNTLQGQRFAARFMGDIKGQQMLPQSVFRQFLNEIDFSEAKQLHDDLVKAQGQIEQALQQAEQVSDMNSLHYTDVGGEETPFYIYIDMDDPELAGIEANDETALWQGIDRILQAKRTTNIQIVDLNINHRGLHECSYLYFSTSVVKSNRRVEHEYLWSAEGYYKRAVYQKGNTTDWEWRDIYADIAAAYTLAHSNEQRLDAVEGTANEANQRSKDNLTRLDSVEGTANATKALADVHTTRLNKVEGVANEANTRSQDNMKRLDQVEGVANGAQALANNHTELINKVENTANTALSTANNKADKVHTHTSIGTGSTSVEADGNNVKVYDGNGIQVFKTLNKYGKDNVDYPDEIGVEFRTADATEVENKGSHSLGIISNKRIKLGGNGSGVENIKITTDAGNVGFITDADHTTIKRGDGYFDTTNERAKINHSEKVALAVFSKDVIKATKTETTLLNYNTGSMGLRLRADQSELKFGGKGITITETETKVTSSGKVELLAPSVEARDNENNPIFSTGRYTKNGSTTDEKQTIIFVGNKEYHAGDGTSTEIVLNGDIELCTALQELQSKRTRFEMPMTIEWILSKGKLLNAKFCEYLYNAITQYYGNYDYENDDNSGMLRMLSGENIYPVILSKYYHVGEKTAHAQHFKPWQVEFYDEIQSYDSPDGVVSIPVIRIHIGEDFAEWLVHTGYQGLSEKVSYLEFGIGRDEMGNMPFSIYNASGTKLQEFTLI